MGLPDGPWDTVNVLALDAAGHLAVGVSTSGYPWKYPGRVSDSAIIGAGNYCDDAVGGAACTGRGELAIRGTTARSVLHALAADGDPAKACAEALAQTLDLPDEFRVAAAGAVPDPGRPPRRRFHHARVDLQRDDRRGRDFPDPRAEADLKIFLSSDMEGTAGVVDWEQCVG